MVTKHHLILKYNKKLTSNRLKDFSDSINKKVSTYQQLIWAS
jgi:hypothetical protein